MMGTSVIYPRFLGKDDSGDFVWELADGRWTWGDDPLQAADRKRTFAPDRYVEKYGAPQPLPGEGSPKQAEAEPLQVSAEALEAATREAFADGQRRGAEKALAAMAGQAKGWAEGSAENQQAMGSRDARPAHEQEFMLADILRMVDDAAREAGVAPIYSDLGEGK